MKRNSRLGMNKPMRLIIGVLFLLSLTNCKKASNEGEPEVPYVAKNETSIVFSLASIEDAQDTDPSASNGEASASADGLPRLKKVSAQSEIVSLGDVDAIMTISEDIPDEYKQKEIIGSSARTSSNAENKAARVLVNLASGTTYRVVLYTDNGSGAPGTYVGQAQGKVGTANVSIPANRNTKYVWYAYTFNNTNNINAYPTTATPTSSIAISPTSNSSTGRHDFAYSKGLITTNNVLNGTNPIRNLVLTRKTSRIIVELNSRGMFAPITYASLRFGSNSGMASANFSLRDSSLSNISQTLGALNVYNHNSSASVVTVGTDSVLNLNTKKRYTFYTPTNGVGTRAFTVAIDTIRLTSQRVREDNTNSVTPQTTAVERMFTNKTFSFPGFIARPGKSYFLSIKLVESPVTVGTTKWARADVWRDAAANTSTTIGLRQAYKFRYDNPLYKTTTAVPASDYFTNDIYNISGTGKNICELVYPEGTWDLPTTTQIDELQNLLNKEQPETSDYRWYLKINATAATATQGYPNGFLSFSPIGYKTSQNGSTFDFHPGDPTYFEETHGYWRTKTRGTYAQSLNAEGTGPVFQGIMMSKHDMDETRLAPVRCVRK